MRAAAAQIGLHRCANIRVGRIVILLQQALRPHDHAGDAVSALRRLFVDECALQRPRVFDRAEAFDGGYLLAVEQQQGRQAGEYGFAIHHDGAGAALAQATAELGAVKGKIVPQHIEQGRIGFRIDLVVAAVDVELYRSAPSWFASEGPTP